MNKKYILYSCMVFLTSLACAASVQDCFKEIESAGSGDYRATNSMDFLGRYQMGVPRMVDLGYCTPVSNGKVIDNYWAWNRERNKQQGLQTNMNHWDECQWTQKAKDMGVNSREDFLNNTGGIQDTVYNDQISQIEREYNNGGFDQYVGQVDPNTGVTMTKETMMYMIHNGGAGSAKDYLNGKHSNSEMTANVVKMDNCMGGNSTMPPGTGGGGGNQSLCV